MARIEFVIVALVVILGLVAAEPSRVSLDLKCARVIDGKGTWSTNQFKVVHFKLPGRVAPDRAVDYLLTDLGVEMGRTGRGPFRMAKEFFDMPYSKGLDSMKEEGAKSISWVSQDPRMTPKNLERWENDELIMSDEAEVIDYLEATGKTAREFGRFVSNVLKSFNDPSKGIECPRFYEPLNEGMNHQWKKTNPKLSGTALNNWKVAQVKKVATIHREICRSIKFYMADDAMCRPMCGGWAAGWVDFSTDSFRIFRERLKTYVDEAGRDSDFISLHTYDSIKEAEESKTSGGFIDNVLDITQTYLRNTIGFKPIVISEYGAASNQVWFKEQSDGEKKALAYCASRDFYIIHSVTAMMMQYSFYPHMIVKAVPFLTMLEDIEEKDPSPWSLMRTVHGKLTWTHLVKIYEILKGVQGEYRRVNHRDPQLYTHVLTDGDEVYILLKNMVRETKELDLDFVSGFPDLDSSGTEMRRLYLEDHHSKSQCARENNLPRSGEPKLTIKKFGGNADFSWLNNFRMRPEEFVVIKLALKRAPRIARRSDIKYWYANSYIKQVERGSDGWTPMREFVFDDSMPQGVGTATIRVGLATYNVQGVQCRVLLNDELVPGKAVPSGPELGSRSRWIMLEYFTNLQNVKPPAGRKTTVKVSCTMYQGQISTVTIKTEKELEYSGEDEEPLDKEDPKPGPGVPDGGGSGSLAPPEIDEDGGDVDGITEEDRRNPAAEVVNGNFERGLTGWTKSRDPTPKIQVMKPPLYKNHVVRIEDEGNVSQKYKVVPGIQYELSATIRTPRDRMACYLSVRIYDKSNELILRENTFSNSKTWTSERVVFTAPTRITEVTLLLASWTPNTVCFFDNVKVRKLVNNPVVSFETPVRTWVPTRGSINFDVDLNLPREASLETVLWTKNSAGQAIWYARELVQVAKSTKQVAKNIKIWSALTNGRKYRLTARVMFWRRLDNGQVKRFIIGEKTYTVVARE